MSTIPVAAGNPKVQASAIFGNISAAKVRIDANYERAGHYLERIDKIKLDQNRKGDAFLAVEKTIVQVLDNDQGKGHKLGESICHMMMAKHDSFLGNVKAMLAAIMGMMPEEIQAEHAQSTCAADQPLTGTVVECQNRLITTKENKLFTAVNYKREVTAAELLKLLHPDVIRMYFPNDVLSRIAAQEALATTPTA